MENHHDAQGRIADIERRIAELPPGSMTKKNVNGHEYHYHRWNEDGKRREKYVPAGEVELLCAQIEERKELEKELKTLGGRTPRARRGAAAPQPASASYDFATTVLTGEDLVAFSRSVRSYRARECFQKLHGYVHGDSQDKVFVLYGLRRTGKTTMIRQVLAGMNKEELARAAFIQITAKDTLAEVNHDLRILYERGFRYVFLDEVTMMEDFIEGAALLSDIYVACGMRIVLSGTDSLGFMFTQDDQLYDRCILLHTTFIPYREFEGVLGISGIDEYIRYGGTMSLGGVRYNETSTFATKESADEYVDTAIARNIQHALARYQHGGHFRHLRDLYDADELMSAINRVVEDINHRFAVSVFTRDFVSHDLGLSASNLRRDREQPNDILDRIDTRAVTEELRRLLEIRNEDEQTVEIDGAHATEIEEYLELLDLVQRVDVRHLPDVGSTGYRTVIAQPGLRYAQASALICSLLLDETFSALSLPERAAVQERILDEIRGRMMEDIVLLETKVANPRKQVFTLQFAVGEFDMVVFDPACGSCEAFEIKHSAVAVPEQSRHLRDEEKCAQAEHRYGPITAKTVLYRGEEQEIEGIRYRNVEEYLRGLR